MSKAMLVLDEMPERCADCRMAHATGLFDKDKKRSVVVCLALYEEIISGLYGTRPDWCPLRPVPEYVNPEPMAAYNTIMYAVDHTPQWEKGMAEGWNACLDAITGGEKNEQSTDN